MLTTDNQKSSLNVDIARDGIVLEGDESFALQVHQTGGQQPVIFVQNTNITVTDSDGEAYMNI